MANKIFNVTFNISGALNSAFLAAMRGAQNGLKNLGKNSRAAQVALKTTTDALRAQRAGLLRVQDSIKHYKQLKQAVEGSAQAVAQAKKQQMQLLARWQQEQRAVEQQKAALDRLKAARRQDKSSVSTAEIRAAQESLKTQRELAKQAKTNYTNQSSSVGRANAGLRSQAAELSRLSSQLSAAGFSVDHLSASEARLRSELDTTTNAINRQEHLANARQNRTDAAQNLSNAYNNFQNSIDTAQNIMSPFTGAIQDAQNFQQKMSELKAISQIDLIKAGNLEQANKNMERLKKQAKELGRSTIYTGEDVLDAQIIMARTGMQQPAIEKATEPLLKLAAANHANMKQASDIATNIMMGFGMDMTDQKNFTHVADVLSYATSHSNSDLMMLGESMKYAAPVAKNFGSSLEETTAILGVMHDAGIQGSMAGTSLRQTMLRLTAPPKKASKAMKEMGVTMSDATKAWNEANEMAQAYGITLDSTAKPGKQMANIVRQINEKMGDKSGQEKMGVFSAITGINAVSGATSLFDRGADYLDDFTAALENSDGTTEAMYKTMTDNAWGAQEAMKSAFDAVSHSIGDALLPASDAAYRFATDMATGVDQFIQENESLVQAAAVTAAAISGIIVASAGFSVAVAGIQFMGAQFDFVAAKALMARAKIAEFWAANTAGSSSSAAVNAIRNLGSAFMGAARAAMAFVFSPVGLALMALALAGLYCYQNWSTVGPIFQQIGGVLMSSLGGAVNMLMPAFQTLWTAIQRLAPALGVIGGAVFAAFATVLNVVVHVAATIISTFAAIVSYIVGAFGSLGNVLASLLAGDFSGAWDAFIEGGKQALDAVLNVFKTFFSGIGDTISHLFDPINAMLGQSSGGGTFGAATTPAQTTPPVDSAPLTASMNEASAAAQENATANQNAANAAQNFASNVDAQNQATSIVSESVTAIQENIAGLGEGITNASTELPIFQQNTNATSTELTNLQTNITATSPQIQQLGTAAQGAVAGITSLGNAASSTSSSLSQISSAAGSVASALSAKASEISSIKISAPSVSSAPVAANAKGGIYPKGAFLTTFAEQSPEAAIPLDNSDRAVKLWQQAGQMLGQLPGNSTLDKTPNNQKLSTIEKARQRRAETVLQQAKNVPRVTKSPVFAPAPQSTPDLIKQPVPTFPAPNTKPTPFPDVLNPIPTFPTQPPKPAPTPAPMPPPTPQLSDRVLNSKSGKAIQAAMNRQNTNSTSILKNPVKSHDGNLNLGSISPVGLKFGGNIFGGSLTDIFSGGIQLPGTPAPKLQQMPLDPTAIKHFTGEGLLTQALNNTQNNTPAEMSLPPINLSITINGNANSQDVQDAGEQLSVNLVRKLEDWWNNKLRDNKRRSFL